MQPEPKSIRPDAVAAIQGDSVAFGRLYDQLYDRVYGYVFRRVYDQAAANDITANIFYKIMTKITVFTWNNEASFYAWVFRIAMNEIATFYRSNNRYALSEEWLQVPSEADSQHEEMIRDEEHRILKAALESLPHKYREVVELYYFANLSHKQIAATLGIREGSARVRLHRAIENLQQAFNKEYGS